MKSDIHPKYGTAVIRCACGNVIETRSTKPEISVDICSACHPQFTGKQKLIDTAGMVDKFKAKAAKQAQAAAGKKGKRVKRAARAAKKQGDKKPIKKTAAKKKAAAKKPSLPAQASKPASKEK